MLDAALKTLHVMSVILWIGGMAFAHFFLRPSLGVLEPPARLALMTAVLGRFFRAVVVEVTGSFGPETLDYRFFAPEEIPWESIYYPAIRQILERYIEERQAGVYGIYIGNDDSGKVHFIR